jgi:ADP-ribose pyrophosphatase
MKAAPMSLNDKPNAGALKWRLRESHQPYANETFAVRVDDLSLSSENQLEYGYLERAGAVVVVPVTRDSQIVTLRQYRYPIDDWCVEVPAGGTHDVGDASLEDVVRKELREEVGATCGGLTAVGHFFTAPSLTDEQCHVFLAENVEVTRAPDEEASEEIRVQLLPAQQVVEMARSGKMKNGPCALAVLWCEPLLRQRGYI